MSQPTVRITGSRLPAYFNGHHRSAYLGAFGRPPEPIHVVPPRALPQTAQQSASPVRGERTDTLVGSVR